jgi:hypothetical protein
MKVSFAKSDCGIFLIVFFVEYCGIIWIEYEKKGD